MIFFPESRFCFLFTSGFGCGFVDGRCVMRFFVFRGQGVLFACMFSTARVVFSCVQARHRKSSKFWNFLPKAASDPMCAAPVFFASKRSTFRKTPKILSFYTPLSTVYPHFVYNFYLSDSSHLGASRCSKCAFFRGFFVFFGDLRFDLSSFKKD